MQKEKKNQKVIKENFPELQDLSCQSQRTQYNERKPNQIMVNHHDIFEMIQGLGENLPISRKRVWGREETKKSHEESGIRMTSDCSTITVKGRRQWSNKILKENNLQPRIL